MDEKTTTNSVEVAKELLLLNDREELERFLETQSSKDLVYLMNHLGRKDQHKLLIMLSAEDAADLIEELPDFQAADIIEDMDASKAAAIINEMMSDDQADIIFEMEDEEAEAILTEMDPEDAAAVRKIMEYDQETAGGLMVSEFFSYPISATVGDVISDFQKNADDYKEYNVKYIYVVSDKGEMLGILQVQDLLLANHSKELSKVLDTDVVSVKVNEGLDELENLLDTYDFYGFPVVDDNNILLGVLRRKSVQEALSERVAFEHLETQGIVGGDELRSMPVMLRSKRRLSWLSVNILLNIIAASVIAFYQDTLSSVIALAVFLPIISDMSGCTGNQAVAVSMRELSLGTVRPSEVLKVWWQEIRVGLLSGLVLGLLIGLAAYLWKSNIYLGMVVGGALMINTLIAVSIGGTVPLILKRMNIDPALASGPILTTITDMFGFFLALGFATLMLDKLTGL